jgi:hypothetical protein
MRRTAKSILGVALLVVLASTCIAATRVPRLERGEVIIERLDRGRFQIRIVRRDWDPQITCNLSGYISKGVALFSEISRFAIHRRYRDGSEWSSYGKPLAGYIYFFRHDGKDFADVQLLLGWSSDNHERRPEIDGINGAYRISGTGLEKLYDVNVRSGRKEKWLESN